ncbi:MAG: alpha/beta hydrolase [Polyangiaceae bacterium]|nr:alpha/beta hydrolase [Polyangiaceae bacterium]
MEGSGEPLLMLMGIGAQLVHWPDGFVERLRAEGFQTIRIDNRDVGMSTHLRHLPAPDMRATLLRTALGLPISAPYTLADMADDALGVLDALGIPRAHVLGASMGGMIAQTFALRHTGRVASLTSIMSTPGDKRYAFAARPSALGALLGRPPRTREEMVVHFSRIYRAIGSRTHATDEAILRQIAERSFDRGLNPPGFARHMAAICASGSRRSALRTLRVPTLVVHGAQDPLIPVAAGRATARLVPDARLLELGDMGHDLPQPLWGAVAGAVRAIAERAPSA